MEKRLTYWPAENGHLEDYAQALINYLENMVPHGKDAAKKLFGCNGIWLPLSSDNWGCSTPETFGWSVWVEVAAFFEDFLVKDNEGTYQIMPSQ